MERVRKEAVTITDFDSVADNKTLIQTYLDDAKCMGLTKKSIENYYSCLKVFSGFLNKSMMDVNIDDLKKFKLYITSKKNKDGEKFSPATISRYFTTIQSLYEFLEFEEYINVSPMPKFRKRYLREFRRKRWLKGNSRRKLISVEEMSMLINSIIDPRDKAVVVTLAKTGIRREELSNINIDDVDYIEQCIHLKPTPKRTNLDVFFDDECARVLKRWMASRKNRPCKETKALFLNERGGRLGRNAIYELVVKYATKVGLHNKNSHKIQDRFTTHCTRHWYCTHLEENGMPREYIQILRGDAIHEAIDIYLHIPRDKLRDSYLACIPQLGID